MEPRTPSHVVGVRVRDHRDLHDLTQAQLAQRLEVAFDWSIDRSMIARIEKGERTVSIEELFMLAAVLDTTPVLLMTPADETELMQPTPWRAMTSSRARAWITDQVRMWEQDDDLYQASKELAWARTKQFHAEMDTLLAKVAALYGEQRIEDVDPEAELSEKARAGVDVVELQLELAQQRHNWLTHVGPWKWRDPGEEVALLDNHPLFTSRASRELFDRAPAEEILARHEASKVGITTGEGAAARVEGLVEDVLDVLGQLARAVAAQAASTPSRPERLERPSNRMADPTSLA
jgi:transcriptional regulator with XRE-family HTH domain